MAYLRKTKTGWRAEIERQGVRRTKTLPTKEAARAWAAREEAAMLDGNVSKWPRKTVGDAFDRYGDEVSSRKATSRAEVLRLNAIRKDFPALASKLISEVTTADVAAWRDARLAVVSRSSVQRDANLLRHVWTVASREWAWCPEPTPWRAIKLPGDNPPRQRIATWREIRRIVRRCGYVTGKPPQTVTEAVGWAVLIAGRTGLRAQEVVGLSSANVDLVRGVVRLTRHKTAREVGDRLVPLTPQARRLLAVRLKSPVAVSLHSLDALWRKYRDQSLIADLHFHDMRATALTHLARRVDVMTLARISGHRDLSMLLGTYYRETPEQIAARLASPKR